MSKYSEKRRGSKERFEGKMHNMENKEIMRERQKENQENIKAMTREERISTEIDSNTISYNFHRFKLAG